MTCPKCLSYDVATVTYGDGYYEPIEHDCICGDCGCHFAWYNGELEVEDD